MKKKSPKEKKKQFLCVLSVILQKFIESKILLNVFINISLIIGRSYLEIVQTAYAVCYAFNRYRFTVDDYVVSVGLVYILCEWKMWKMLW